MVYDCFIFNDELDLLELRLQLLHPAVDKFVLVESSRTLSGQSKPLHYAENKNRFRKFESQIIHVIAPANELPAWEYEYFQRNCIKDGLKEAHEEDLVFISDADEIVNIPEVLRVSGIKFPTLIEIPMYYYYLNVKTNFTYWVNLAASVKIILTIDLGPRNEGYPKLDFSKISTAQCNTGWHFSYCYGTDIKKYQEKIEAFSHQEYSTPYYLDKTRIKKCVTLLIDLFERSYVNLNPDDTSIIPLLLLIKDTPLEAKLYRGAATPNKLLPGNLFFILKKKYIPKIKRRLNEIFTKKQSH